MKYLLDTNVLSELMKAHSRRHGGATNWLARHAEESWISVITVLEIVRGIRLLARRQPNRAAQLAEWFVEARAAHEDRIIDVTEPIARQAADWMVAHQLQLGDAVLAATAANRNLICVTRNERDLARPGIPLLNPFTA